MLDRFVGFLVLKVVCLGQTDIHEYVYGLAQATMILDPSKMTGVNSDPQLQDVTIRKFRPHLC